MIIYLCQLEPIKTRVLLCPLNVQTPCMTVGGDALESEVRGKCVSAMYLVRFASSDFCTLAHSLWLHSLTVGLQINCKSARDARWEIPG